MGYIGLINSPKRKVSKYPKDTFHFRARVWPYIFS